MYTLSVLNQKGGVGKTTTVLGLASSALSSGLRVLVLDMDPQGNTTAAIGVSGSGPTMNDVLYNDRRGCAADSLWETEWGDGIRVIPAVQALSDREADVALGVEHRLAKALDSDRLRDEFDLCLIDCPPSVGRLVSNALIASDATLVVTEPAFMASSGVAQVLTTIGTVREHYNSRLAMAGVVVNKVPGPPTRESSLRLAELEEEPSVKDLIWRPYMPHRTALAEAAGNGVPIHRHTPKARYCIDTYDNYMSKIAHLSGHATLIEKAHRDTTPEPETPAEAQAEADREMVQAHG